ncbi:MAG TPA: hypothetical protein VFG04_22560 [Planctomycetaceae bacterium]|jgi:hypothetical protein|nr:hypothetical protein [Planctomycetaceae bacterium]
MRRCLKVLAASATLLWFGGHFAQAAPPKVGPPKDEPSKASNKTLTVRVTFENRPAAGAQVIATDFSDHTYHIAALTDRDGKAQLQLAPDGKISGIVVLDPKRGVGGHWFGARSVPAQPGMVLDLPLAPAQPHTIRLVDGNGQAVRLAAIGVASVATEKRGWLPTDAFEVTHLHTDSRGEALVGWVPRDAKSVGVEILDDRWKLDTVDRSQTASGLTTVKVRRLHPIDGRLSMPDGTSPEGLLITGTGIGSSASTGHNPSAHVRRDGTFTLYVAADHAYSLCLVDDKWASDSWTGVLLTKEDAAPKSLDFVAYPAIPLSVRVTRGPKHEPVEGAWVNVQSGDQFFWLDARGERQMGDGGPQRGLYTDKTGRAQFGVGKGKQEVFLATGNWREPRTIKVTSDDPTTVEFYRPWVDKRTISGQLVYEHRPHKAGPATIVRGWNPVWPQITSEAIVAPDGRFTLSIDAPDVYLFAVDPKNLLSAARSVAAAAATAELDLTPLGSLSGVIVNTNGKRLASQGVQLVFAGLDFQMWQIVVQSTTSDERGYFRFDSVPAGVPVRIYAGTPASVRGEAFSKQSDKFQIYSSRDVTLDPGEVRENIRLVKKVERTKDQAPAPATGNGERAKQILPR